MIKIIWIYIMLTLSYSYYIKKFIFKKSLLNHKIISNTGMGNFLYKYAVKDVWNDLKIYFSVGTDRFKIDDIKSFNEIDSLDSIKDNNSTVTTKPMKLVNISSNNQQAKKAKGPKPSKIERRKPYFTYISSEGILIKVGRSSVDNDELSLNQEHRDSNHWWLHVAGCSGSHVVICDSNDDLPTVNRQTLIDAAVLATNNSTAPKSGKVRVTYTRCRHITKPRGVPAGTVQIRDEVNTLTINLGTEAERLNRLLLTKNQPLPNSMN